MLTVRLATTEELSIVHEVMLASFEELRGVLDPPSGAHAETLEDVIVAVEKGGAILALVNKKPVGTARYELHPDHLYCGRVGVLPDHRGQGIASAILEFIDEVAREHALPEVRLSTREVMESNLRLYERLGYRITSRAPHKKGTSIVVELSKRLL